jgi:hypothetical protein
MVGLDLGRAKINITNLAGSAGTNFWITFASSFNLESDANKWLNLTFQGGWIIGSYVTGTLTAGPSAFRFNTASAIGNRFPLRNCRIQSCYKGLSFGSSSYFTRFYDLSIEQCGYQLYQEAGASNFAEKITFINCVIDNGDFHVYDLGGQVWTFITTSLDYHGNRIAYLSNGAKMTCQDCHMEWNYGQTGGQTNQPIYVTGSNSMFEFVGGSLNYTGSGVPFYPSHVFCDNTTNRIIIKPSKVSGLGMQASTTALDAMVVCIANAQPNVQCELWSTNIATADVPAMSLYVDFPTGTGVGGTLRDGVDEIYNELSGRIALTGACAISDISAAENSMTLMNSRNCLKITGIGTVSICFPIYGPFRRHAWQFFTNSVFLTGSATIKEASLGYLTKFDGTTVTFAADPRGAAFQGTTITLTNAGGNVWTRQNWKLTNSGSNPSIRLGTANVLRIVIDTTSMSAGALYLAYAAFDLL